MHAAIVVVHEVQRNLVRVIFKLLAESICEPRESPHPHPHRKILALYVAGRDVLRVGIAASTPVRHPMQVAGL